MDPLLLALQVWRETRRKVQFLIAAKSMKRKAVGFFASLMSSSAYPLLLSHIDLILSTDEMQYPSLELQMMRSQEPARSSSQTKILAL